MTAYSNIPTPPTGKPKSHIVSDPVVNTTQQSPVYSETQPLLAADETLNSHSVQDVQKVRKSC